MKVNSTGLGKTTMVAEFAGLTYLDEESGALRLNIEATQPVHWSIKVTMGGSDLRQFVKLLLSPSVVFQALTLLIKGSTV